MKRLFLTTALVLSGFATTAIADAGVKKDLGQAQITAKADTGNKVNGAKLYAQVDDVAPHGKPKAKFADKPAGKPAVKGADKADEQAVIEKKEEEAKILRYGRDDKFTGRVAPHHKFADEKFADEKFEGRTEGHKGHAGRAGKKPHACLTFDGDTCAKFEGKGKGKHGAFGHDKAAEEKLKAQKWADHKAGKVEGEAFEDKAPAVKDHAGEKPVENNKPRRTDK